jgi:hypothetical protein
MGRRGKARSTRKPSQVAARLRGSTPGVSLASLNPAVSNVFEQRQNRKLHTEALGRRVRGAQKNVALARGRAAARREGELVQEYLTQHRTNTITDRRIGEGKGFTMSEEEKALARFRKERKLQAAAMQRGKSSRKFNLDDDDEGAADEDDEDFTHGGMPVDARGPGFDFGGQHDDEGEGLLAEPPERCRQDASSMVRCLR